jgi:hypothetical protein
MKLTKETIKRIIKEELQKVINESMSSSDLVYKIEQLVFSGREGYNQAEALVDYALPMMDPQDAEYIDAIFQAGRATDKSNAIGREIIDSFGDGSYSKETFKDDFGYRVEENDERYFRALDKIEDIKGEHVRRKLHRIFRSF